MRVIRKSAKFKREAKRLSKNRALVAELLAVVNMLAADIPLPQKYCDHPLHNNWEGCRDCHIRTQNCKLQTPNSKLFMPHGERKLWYNKST